MSEGDAGGIAAWVGRLRRRPPRPALEWVAATVGPGARVMDVRPLRGGIGTAMHVVAVAHGGTTRRVVLRRVLPWGEADAAAVAREAVAREAAVLDALTRHGAPVPRVLAADPDGNACDCPALVMTRLPGWRRLPPRPAPAWVDSLAAALHALHTLPVAGLPELSDRLGAIAQRLAGPVPPPYPDRPADLPLLELAGQRVAAIAAAGDVPAVLLHDDYWSGNTLRLGHRVTAVVDWSSPALGPAGLDVGYCAMDLALCYGDAARDRFVAAYERFAGGPVADLAVWELVAALRAVDVVDWLSCWNELGLSLTAEVVTDRLAQVKVRTFATAGGGARPVRGRRPRAAAATPR